jgi:hypothetical protein
MLFEKTAFLDEAANPQEFIDRTEEVIRLIGLRGLVDRIWKDEGDEATALEMLSNLNGYETEADDLTNDLEWDESRPDLAATLCKGPKFKAWIGRRAGRTDLNESEDIKIGRFIARKEVVDRIAQEVGIPAKGVVSILKVRNSGYYYDIKWMTGYHDDIIDKVCNLWEQTPDSEKRERKQDLNESGNGNKVFDSFHDWENAARKNGLEVYAQGAADGKYYVKDKDGEVCGRFDKKAEDGWIHTSDLNEDVDETKPYCVVRTGGYISMKSGIVATFDTAEEAKEYASRMNKARSQGDREYYKIHYSAQKNNKGLKLTTEGLDECQSCVESSLFKMGAEELLAKMTELDSNAAGKAARDFGAGGSRIQLINKLDALLKYGTRILAEWLKDESPIVYAALGGKEKHGEKIEEAFGRPINLDEIAKDFGISYRQVFHILKKRQIGNTISKLAQEYKMNIREMEGIVKKLEEYGFVDSTKDWEENMKEKMINEVGYVEPVMTPQAIANRAKQPVSPWVGRRAAWDAWKKDSAWEKRDPEAIKAGKVLAQISGDDVALTIDYTDGPEALSKVARQIHASMSKTQGAAFNRMIKKGNGSGLLAILKREAPKFYAGLLAADHETNARDGKYEGFDTGADNPRNLTPDEQSMANSETRVDEIDENREAEGPSAEFLQWELDQIDTFMRKSDGDYDDYDWDGTELVVFNGGEVIERYNRQDLEEAGVFTKNEAVVPCGDGAAIVESISEFARNNVTMATVETLVDFIEKEGALEALDDSFNGYGDKDALIRQMKLMKRTDPNGYVDAVFRTDVVRAAFKRAEDNEAAIESETAWEEKSVGEEITEATIRDRGTRDRIYLATGTKNDFLAVKRMCEMKVSNPKKYRKVLGEATDSPTTLSPGQYWIGDLCYVMHDVWNEVVDKMYEGDTDHEGEVITLNDGREFLYFGTAHGDGEYFDNEGNAYGVDAGIIGIIALEDIKQDGKNDLANGRVEMFSSPFSCAKDGGVLIFGGIQIDTDPQEDSDEDYENEYPDDDIDEAKVDSELPQAAGESEPDDIEYTWREWKRELSGMMVFSQSDLDDIFGEDAESYDTSEWVERGYIERVEGFDDMTPSELRQLCVDPDCLDIIESDPDERYFRVIQH